MPQTKESYHNQIFRILKSLRGKYFETVAHVTLCGYFLTLSMCCREGKGEGGRAWWPSETLRVGWWLNREARGSGSQAVGRRHAFQSRLLTWILYSLLAWHGSCISCGCGGEIEKEVLEYQRRSFGFSFGMTEVAAGAWVGAVLGSLAVGLTGLAPLLFIPTQAAISTSQVGF